MFFGSMVSVGGNQLSKTKNGTVTAFTLNSRNQIARIEENGLPIGVYGYDHQGLRVRKYTDHETRYLYDDQSVLQRDDANDGTVYYEYGPDRLLSVKHPSEGRSFYLHDALGSVVAMTGPGASLLGQYSYDAWGNYRHRIENQSNVFGFTGHEMDGESGLVYAKARFYDPEVGRFLSHDPVEGNQDNPPSLHRYSYVFQNPSAYVDPDGRNPRAERDMQVMLELQRSAPELGPLVIENIPIVDKGIEAANLWTGKDILRDEKLSNSDKALSAAFLIPVPKVVKKGLAKYGGKAVTYLKNTKVGQVASGAYDSGAKKVQEVVQAGKDKLGKGVGKTKELFEAGKEKAKAFADSLRKKSEDTSAPIVMKESPSAPTAIRESLEVTVPRGIPREISEAANRLGIDPQKIDISNGVARVKIEFSETLSPADIRVLRDHMNSQGASKLEIESGFLANEKLEGFLNRRVQDGKPFHGGKVRKSDSERSDFVIEMELD